MIKRHSYFERNVLINEKDELMTHWTLAYTHTHTEGERRECNSFDSRRSSL